MGGRPARLPGREAILYVYMYVCIYIYIYNVCIVTYIYIYIYIYIHMHACMHAMFKLHDTLMFVCIHIYIYIYSYIHVYIHIYIYIYIYNAPLRRSYTSGVGGPLPVLRLRVSLILLFGSPSKPNMISVGASNRVPLHIEPVIFFHDFLRISGDRLIFGDRLILGYRLICLTNMVLRVIKQII